LRANKIGNPLDTLPPDHGQEEERRGDTMLFDRQKFVLAVHQALKEHDKEKDNEVDSGGHHVAIDCDHKLEQFADRILELME
jgi:hypothetical protein